MLWVVFKVAGVTFGSLLGVFLLGLLTTRRVADGANVAAMIVMALMNLTLLVLSEMKVLTFGWSWLVVLGTIGTMLLPSSSPRLRTGAPPDRANACIALRSSSSTRACPGARHARVVEHEPRASVRRLARSGEPRCAAAEKMRARSIVPMVRGPPATTIRR